MLAVLKPGQQQQHLHQLPRLPALGCAEPFNRGLPRCLEAGECCRGKGDDRVGDRHGFLLVGGVGTVIADQDQVFASLRCDHEFLGGGTTDGAAVGIHRHRLESAALEDASVGLIHHGVGRLQIGFVGVKGIGIFHDEFTPTHQAEPGADLIPELGLHLVKVHGKLPVGAQQLASQAGDHLLMGRSQTQLAPLAVFQVKHDPFAGGVPLPSATALPEL